MNSNQDNDPVGWASRPPFLQAVGETPILRGTTPVLRPLIFVTPLLSTSVNAQIQAVGVSTNRTEDSRSLLLLSAIVFSLVILIVSVLTKKYRALWIALTSIAAIAALLYFKS